MEFIKKNMLAVIVAGAGILALFFALILPGAAGGEDGVDVTISVFGLAFGGPSVKITYESVVTTMEFTGGLSIFGLLSVIVLVAGIALTLASIKVKGKKLDLYGAILVAVAGILMFLLLVSVGDVGMAGVDEKIAFSEIDEAYRFALGAGAIIYGIVALIGGAYGAYKLTRSGAQVADEE